MKRRWLGCLLLVAANGGCMLFDPEPNNGRIGSSRGNTIKIDKLPKATLDAYTHADSLGKQILASNPDVKIAPMFLAYGVPELMIFHQGTETICISEGLINRCKTDGELAALFCSELSKMVAEAQMQNAERNAVDIEPPYAPRVANDAVDGRTPDQTNLAEQAIFERSHPRRNIAAPAALAVDPNVLAKSYMFNLAKTNPQISADDLAKVAPLLRLAENNPKANVYQNTATRGEGLGMPKP